MGRYRKVMKNLYFQGSRLNWVDITSRKGGRIKMQSIETAKTVSKILLFKILALMSTLYIESFKYKELWL